MSNQNPRKWLPEIVYEEYEGGLAGQAMPFIQIPEGKEMPDMLFIFGTKPTGEFEPDAEGNEQPIMEMEPYSFANMKYLEDELDAQTFDKIRVVMGLLPLKEAREKGRKLSKDMVEKNLKK